MENPEQFIKEKYWGNKEFREATEQAAKRTERREGKKIPDEPQARIENYLKRFTDILEREDEKDRTHGLEALQRLLHKKYVIKSENISDDYIKGVLFGNFAEEQGYTRDNLRDPEIKAFLLKQFREKTGQDFETYAIPKEERERIQEMAINDQKARLDSWLNYLTSDEAENYPAAYRYWAFAEMLKLGAYDDERKTYNKRTETTAAPFPELDQQALALVLDEIQRKQRKEPSQIIPHDENTQEEFRKRLDSENFGKLYAFFQEYLKTLRLPLERLAITQGEWKVFKRGSNPKEVVKALQGFHTQWCIAGEGTAASYLKHSDLHIYFSQDAEGNNTIPRACIVSKQAGITEVRGIMSDEIAKQHLDDYIVPVVQEKLSEIPGGEKWQAKMEDMRRLASIHINYKQRGTLTKEDLRFLYEIDRKIQSTGYNKDPRIEEILSGRDIKEDLSVILGVPKEQISTTEEEALSGNIKYHYGDLDLSSLTSAEGLQLPESIGGSLYLSSLTSAKGLQLPESIGGRLDLSSLTSAEGLQLPESIGGNLYLSSLTSAKGLQLPESIGGNLDLRSLTSAEGLQLPESIGGSLYLRSLTSAKGLQLPKSIGGDLDLSSLTSAEDLQLPESIGGDLDLRSLTSAEDLQLPKSIGGDLDLSSLTSAEGLQLPESIGGSLDLSSLTSAEGLQLPESIGGSLYLSSLTSAEGLQLPESIGGSLDLSSLTSAKGLQLPKSIGGSLDLRSLTSAEDLQLPESIGGSLDLSSLTSAKGLQLPKSIGGDLYLSSLTSAEKQELREKFPHLSQKII
jgi:putative effector of murein hydrolase